MTTNYTYSDGKAGNTINFVTFEQKWLTLCTSASRSKGKHALKYNVSLVLNNYLEADIKARPNPQ
jgi:hypothetical protein